MGNDAGATLAGAAAKVAAGRAGSLRLCFMRRAIRLWAAIGGAALLGCGGPAAAPPPEVPAVAMVQRERSYALTWGGAALGWARERDDGARWQRREQIVVRRGEQVVVSELELTIERDDRGVARAVALARWQDGPVLRGRAVASEGGWRIDVDGEAPIVVGAATPFELAIAAAPAAGGFRGPVLLAGYGFAIAELAVVRADGGAWTATLTIAGRPLIATIRYDGDGAVREIRGADGVVARAIASGMIAPPATPLEVVAGNALAVDGLAEAVGPVTLWLPGASGPRPPALPGQRVLEGARVGWTIRLDVDAPTELPAGGAGPDRTALIAALAHQVADDVEDDLGATALTEGGARVARRGDCTTHALRFAALAADVGVETRVVTGLRLDGGALVRHRWIVAWTGARWRAIDPTYAEAPAEPLLLGLAVHGARAADLALADAVVFDQLGPRAIAIP